MGLDIRPGGAHWSYSGFMQFRKDLAKEEGLNLEGMEGFGGTIEWGSVAATLEPLLSHSDCDGYIDSYDCDDMLPRLRRIHEVWSANCDFGQQYYIDQLANLITGMEHCAEHGCALVFS